MLNQALGVMVLLTCLKSISQNTIHLKSRNQLLLLLSLFITVAILSCKDEKVFPKIVVPKPPVTPPSTDGIMIFKSGFAGPISITMRSSGQHYDIRGNDGLAKSDWLTDLEQNMYIGSGQFFMEQGDESLRSANIVADPVDATNKVLRMRITDQHILLASGERKCRVQYELNNNNLPPTGGYMKEYYQKCRLYFSSDFKVLEDVVGDDIGWIVMQEYWNDPQYNAPNRDYRQQARTGVEIIKKNGKLHFGAKGRDPEMENPAPTNNSWEVYNNDFAIPLGKWMTEEIYVKEGGSAGTANPGRFYMSITVDNVKTVICDKIGMTTSEAPGYVPDGQTSWSPMKIYTVGKVGNTFHNNNKIMDVYWDDLEIWMNKRP